MKYRFCLLMLVSLLLGFGCQSEEKADVKVMRVTLEGDAVILAKVMGTPITQYELEQVVLTTLGPEQGALLGDEGRRKVLESLVASRAMALASEKELEGEALEAVEKRVAVYREQLLVKKYLAAHADPQPVTAEMVKAYYEKNPERFGARTTVVYEMISTEKALEGDERGRVMEALKGKGEEPGWDKAVADLREQRLPVFYKKGRAVKGMMNPRLYSLIVSIQEGEASDLTFIEGTPYLVRVIQREEVPPRPLGEVSARIRKSLVPVQLKKDVKKVSEQVLGETTVEYL